MCQVSGMWSVVLFAEGCASTSSECVARQPGTYEVVYSYIANYVGGSSKI